MIDKKEEKRLSEDLKRWKEKIKKFDLEKIENSSYFQLKSIYTPLDLKDTTYDDINLSGEFPFTRGPYSTMYRGRLWTMRQYSGFQNAKLTNQRYKYLLEHGQTGLSVAFDLCTQMGFDSDHILAQGEVGKTGVPISSLKDMEDLFAGIPLDQVSTSMTINAPTAIILSMYIALAEKQGVSIDKLRGTVQNDILKEYVARNTYIFPPTPSMRLVADVIEYCSKKLPHFNTISISGYHIREAGATAIQEIAFTLVNAIAYVEEVLKRGLDIDQFASRLAFFFCTYNDFFEEIAKFRAARRMWAKIIKNRFKAQNLKSMQLRFHAQTIGSSLTAQQPDVNLIRVAIQTLASVLGGAQSIHSSSRDEALSLPSKDSVRLSLRTQQVIAYETGAGNVIDPIGGSYYLESLTNQMEEEAFKIIKKIEEQGGAINAIENGFIQKEIQENAYKIQQSIEKGEKIVIGVNKFQIDKEDLKLEILKSDPEIERQQIDKLKKIKESRDNNLVHEKLKKIKEFAKTDENLMPHLIDAVKVYATTGEICDILKEVFGTYKMTTIF
ncbi:Methylmalonyl-CoA mutase [subsurface metagenome]